MKRTKHFVSKIPIIGPALVRLYVWSADRQFRQSSSYWESRYVSGGNSGDGSYGKLATFKADVLNALVDEFDLNSLIEFGCGDGNQLMLANYPKYVGFDVSQTAIDMCSEIFDGDATKSFALMADYNSEVAECALSLDVIFHLVEDDVFSKYMRTLFSASSRLVIIYASNTDQQDRPKLPHVRHRQFTNWIEENRPDWSLLRTVENKFPYEEMSGMGSPASFYIYENPGAES